MSLAIVGSLSLDRVGDGPQRLGGCPFYAARALRALGASAVVVAKCAAPDRPALLPQLIRLGLPVLWRDSTATAAFSFSYNGEGRRMVVEAIADPWTPDELELPLARWIHVAPLTRSDFPPETLAALARGRRISLDGQGLVRPARTGLLTQDADYDPDLLRSVSILKLAEDEAELLVDGLDERSLGRLGVPEIVVTLGSRGCVVYADGIAELVRARRVESPDPTGAGDAFAAVYLAARSRGAAPTAAARRAAALVADLLAGRAA
jgi:sugar/nucleoside kinase (ribokinase family)